MKNIKMLAIVLVMSVAAFFNPKQSSAQQNNVSFQVFYDALSPYGQWVDYKEYGYAWIPDVGSDFVPYSTAGYWTLTDYGWTWVSDYEWGWAPFHYGRWDFDNYYGWLWIPDNEWGPSWVNWRRADGYYGWSPMEPGISISLSFGRPYNSYNDHWMFVRDRDFERRDIYRYSVNRSDHAMIIRHSTVINTTYIDNSRHTTYVTGPSRDDVQRVTGRRINPVSIQESNRPGKDRNDGGLRMYRPQIVKNDRVEHKPEPVRIENIRDVKRPTERNGHSQPGNINQHNKDTRPNQQREASPSENNGRQQPQNNTKQDNTRQQNIDRYQPSQQPQQVSPKGNSDKQQQQNDNRATPVQQPRQERSNPAGSSDRQQQQNATPKGNNAQPQQQQANPASNNQRQQQQNATPRKNNNQTRPEQQQQVNPAVSPQRQPQQNATPQKNNVQPQQANPAMNNQRQQQQNATPQKNNNQPQPAQQQQHAVPANNSQNQQRQNIQKPQNQQMKEQEKSKKATEEKKQNN